MKNIWSLLCRRALIDPQTNVISLIESFEEIEIGVDKDSKGKVINAPIDFELVSYWSKEENDPKEYSGEVKVFDPNKKIIGKFPLALDFSKSRRLRARLQFPSLLIKSQGEYTFQVQYKVSTDSNKFISVAEVPLFVKIVFTDNKKGS